MSYKGQRDYKSCKVQSHTTKKLLNKIKTRQLLIGAGKKPDTNAPPSIMKYAQKKII
jgi:hypothetical protein